MTSILGILFVVVGLLVSVAVHEWGHMATAKRFGVRVPEFAVGFGLKLGSFKRGGTEYSFRAIPLGGFVSIPGMFAPARPGTKLTRPDGSPTMAQEARLESAKDVEKAGGGKPFYQLTVPQKIAVMFAGPLTNALLSILIVCVVFFGIGLREATPGVESIIPEVQTSSGVQTSPAKVAGLQAGDTIHAINGTPITTWVQVQETISTSSGKELTLTVHRQGGMVDVQVTPLATPEGRGVIGVRATSQYVSGSVSQVMVTTANMAAGTAAVLTRLPLAVWDVGVSLVTGAPRDSQGIMSVVGVGRVAAEVTGGDSPLGADNWRGTLSFLLMMLASLNMALFLFNLIPLMPLDGGHIASALYEGGRRQIAKLRGQADPGPADTAKLVPVTQGVAMLLIAMTLIIVLADIVNPISIG